MKRIMRLGLGWDDPTPWKPQKSAEQKECDRQRIRELLEGIGGGDLFRPDKTFYVLDLEMSSEAFHYVMDELQKAPHLLRSPVFVVPIYSEHELSAAPLLVWHSTRYIPQCTGAGIGSYTRDCEACGAPLEQIRDLQVDMRLVGKRDVTISTHNYEFILSARLAGMLQQTDFSGFTLRPAWPCRKPYQGAPRLFQLVVTNVLPPMASPPTQFEEDEPHPKECTVCGRRTYYLKHTHFWGRIQYYEETEVYYRKEVLESAQDFNIAHERFGELRQSHQMTIISQRVYRWLREQGMKGWAAEPVYLVE